MKILFISDIHGLSQNLKNLSNISFDTLIVLGDIYSNYNNEENEIVKKFLIDNRSKLICVQGNCDSTYDYLDLNIPLNSTYIKICDEGLNIYCTHGHLYNYRCLSKFNDSGVIIYGHEHIPSVNKTNDYTYICVGSISKPRCGSPASYCIYEDGIFTVYSITGEILFMTKEKKH